MTDARWFYDGGGVDDEVGDLVQLEGGVEAARVVSIDLDADLLTLDTRLSWDDAQGVALVYAGLAPDPGAFEHGLPDTGGGDTGGSDGGVDDTGDGVADDSGSAGSDVSGGAGTDDGIAATGSADETSGAGDATQDEGNGCSCRSADRSLAGGLWLCLLLVGVRRFVAAARPLGGVVALLGQSRGGRTRVRGGLLPFGPWDSSTRSSSLLAAHRWSPSSSSRSSASRRRRRACRSATR